MAAEDRYLSTALTGPTELVPALGTKTTPVVVVVQTVKTAVVAKAGLFARAFASLKKHAIAASLIMGGVIACVLCGWWLVHEKKKKNKKAEILRKEEEARIQEAAIKKQKEEELAQSLEQMDGMSAEEYNKQTANRIKQEKKDQQRKLAEHKENEKKEHEQLEEYRANQEREEKGVQQQQKLEEERTRREQEANQAQSKKIYGSAQVGEDFTTGGLLQ
jgi:cell division protein FtsN